MQRPNGDKLHIGDNFSLYSKEFKGWLEAEICGIDLNNKRVQVMLVSPGNSMDRVWLSMHSPLISIKHKQLNADAPKL